LEHLVKAGGIGESCEATKFGFGWALECPIEILAHGRAFAPVAYGAVSSFDHGGL
jgi:hypothetical protein